MCYRKLENMDKQKEDKFPWLCPPVYSRCGCTCKMLLYSTEPKSTTVASSTSIITKHMQDTTQDMCMHVCVFVRVCVCVIGWQALEKAPFRSSYLTCFSLKPVLKLVINTKVIKWWLLPGIWLKYSWPKSLPLVLSDSLIGLRQLCLPVQNFWANSSIYLVGLLED